MSEWYYVANGAQQGPVPEADLQRQFASGALLRSTLVWREGMGPWVAANGIPGFAASAAVKPAVLNRAPGVPPPPPAEPASGSSITAQLEQKSPVKGRQTFEIVGKRALRIGAGGRNKGTPREVPLDLINPHFTRISHWPTALLCVSAPACFLTFIIVAATIVSCFTGSRILDLGSLLGINALFLAVVGILLVLVFRQRRNSAVFQVRGEAPVELWFENPTKPAFEEFVVLLQSEISSVTAEA